VSYPFNNYHRRTRRYEKPRSVTRAEEERRKQLDDDRQGRERSASNQRINDEMLAEWNALTDEERLQAIEATRPRESDTPTDPPAPGSIAENWERIYAERDQLAARLFYAREAKYPEAERLERAATRQKIREDSARAYAEKVEYWAKRDAARRDPMSTFGT